jgi:hypothetical protein
VPTQNFNHEEFKSRLNTENACHNISFPCLQSEKVKIKIYVTIIVSVACTVSKHCLTLRREPEGACSRTLWLETKEDARNWKTTTSWRPTSLLLLVKHCYEVRKREMRWVSYIRGRYEKYIQSCSRKTRKESRLGRRGRLRKSNKNGHSY